MFWTVLIVFGGGLLLVAALLGLSAWLEDTGLRGLTVVVGFVITVVVAIFLAAAEAAPTWIGR
ncbi:Na+(H+)/acetate symporter ActP [Catenuloplanes nepalensis]|uniref:Na+(H+)/acetate symporter ActP n=1 Tax=Catenuloplanes nepalensis TaxID=587533 RepID=A0ABT9MSA5_9ACTN|nr:hypothetical protein [Catenuloplanes nepalensis]MDP9794305.1 Na+(H+)/acetate symporter ActP [Catenuloplanes nepalensis]